MKLIVTGATGQFGRSATAFLLERVKPEDLILVTRKPEALADLAARGASVRFGDFDRPESLGSAFAGGERMLLISTARVGGRLPQHKAAVDAAKGAGVGYIAYTSFLRAREAGASLVLKDHKATERLILDAGVSWGFLRDSWYADAIATAIAPRVLATGRWITSTGRGRAAPVAREDCAACASVLLTDPSKDDAAHDITGPELMTIAQMAALVSEIGGKRVDVVQVTDADMYAMFDSLGIPRAPVDDQVVNDIPWCSDDMVSFERAIREGDLEVLSADVERLIGRKPKSLRQVLEDPAPALRAAAGARA